MRTYFRLAALAATLAVAWSSAAFAQSAAGTVSGKVIFDITSQPVHGATVIIIGARRTITTTEAGTFEIPNVPVGTYEVIAQREHFSAARKSVTVTAGQTSTVEFVLSIEAVHENVTVTASASGTATTFESFNAITSLDSVELAKNIGTSLADALATAPGVSKRSFGPGSGRPIIRGFDGDRVLVMQSGRLEQIGTPREIYDTPQTRFIAEFIGVMNFVPASVEENGCISVGACALSCATLDWAAGSKVRQPGKHYPKTGGKPRRERRQGERRNLQPKPMLKDNPRES